jgi:adhesin transport system outer membrane protein
MTPTQSARYAHFTGQYRVAFVLLLLAPFSALAADFTLKQLLEIGADRHPSVLQARIQAQAAGFDVESAQWGRFPTVSTQLRSDTNLIQSLAKVEQPLWTGGKLSSRIELSEANLRAAEAGVREAELNALTQVATAFFEALRLEHRLQSATLNVSEHERLVGLIQRRTEAQISPPADTTLAQARLQQAISERIQIKKQLDASLTTLAQWTVPLNGALNTTHNGSLKAPADIVFKRPAPGELLERAIAHSGQRKRLQSQIDSAEAQINVSKAQVWPTVVAGFQHTWGGLVPANYDRNKGYLGLEFQSGAGLSARTGVQAAASRKEAIQQELETLERNLTAQVSAGLSELEALEAQLEPSKSLLEGTTEVVESYLRQYQVGRKNWLDVLNAQREKTQALYSDADTRYGYQLSKVRLMIMTGDISAQQLTALHD